LRRTLVQKAISEPLAAHLNKQKMPIIKLEHKIYPNKKPFHTEGLLPLKESY
jgi:hypothetical protein